MKRTYRQALRLSRETVRSLSRQELRAVNGAFDAETSVIGTCTLTRPTQCRTCRNGCTQTCRTICFSQDPGTVCCLMSAELPC